MFYNPFYKLFDNNESGGLPETVTITEMPKVKPPLNKAKTVYPMVHKGMYGVAAVPFQIFEAIDGKLTISNSNEKVKYLCANEKETNMLRSLGIDTKGVVCDWYKINLLE